MFRQLSAATTTRALITSTRGNGYATKSDYVGMRHEGDNNMKKHYDSSVSSIQSSSSPHSEFDPNRHMNFPENPKSNPDDYAPYDGGISGDFSRAGMRSAEYWAVDKMTEPYSPRGGEHRYGGIGKYEWSISSLIKGWKGLAEGRI